MIAYVILTVLIVLFSLNMGGGNFAASFAAAHGGKILSKGKAQIFFIIFVILGALLVGQPVARTLGSRIIPRELLTIRAVLAIVASATASLFIANRFHVPQSTSLVTVSSFVGVGVYHRHLFGTTFFYLIPFWVLLPLLGYGLTFFLGRSVYPPRKGNFWVYEKLLNHRDRLKVFVIAASCYNAFSVGTNNVANAVGPLAGAGIIGTLFGLAIVAPIFGLGSIVFPGSLKTASERIVPLGLLSATIICLVTGTLMIAASVLGVPQSFVMIKIAAVFAISGLKNGHKITFANPVTRRTYLIWAITPVVAFTLSYVFASLLAA